MTENPEPNGRIKAYECDYKITVIAYGKNASEAHHNGAQVLEYAEETAGPLRADLSTDPESYRTGAINTVSITPIGYPKRSTDHDARIKRKDGL